MSIAAWGMSVVAQGVGQRSERRGLASAGRAGDDDSEHVPGGRRSAGVSGCGDGLVDGGVDDELDHLAVANGGELAVLRVAPIQLGRRVVLDDEQDAVSDVACVEQLGGDAVFARLLEEGDRLVAVVAALVLIPCAAPRARRSDAGA
jgi:hypothetical protein